MKYRRTQTRQQLMDTIRQMQPVTARQLAGVLYPEQTSVIGIIMVLSRLRLAKKRGLIEFAGFGERTRIDGGTLPAMWRVVGVDPV